MNQELTVKKLFALDEVRNKFSEMIGKKAPGFITSVLQIVSSNQLLAKADPHSVYHAAAVAATLDLPLNNNLGFAYIVPYAQSYKDEKGVWQKKQVAQFQVGYKGYIQLAQRSGQFQTISASAIYEGQLIEENPLTGFVFDFKKKKSEKVIGYAAYFRLINGFEKVFYMTTEQLKAHGVKFSQTFKKDTGLWKDDFDSMATKTVLKLMLSKFAPLSIEMQKAVTLDSGVINNVDGSDATFVDHEVVDKETERALLMIGDCDTAEDLIKLKETIPPTAMDAYEEKLLSFT